MFHRVELSKVLVCSLMLLGCTLISLAASPTPNVKVQFISSRVGWIVGPRLLKTIDGGRTWTELRREGLGTIEAEDIFQGRNWLQFVTPEVGFSVGGSGVAKTVDGGRSWSSSVVTNDQDQTLDALFFISPHEGWVVGADIYHTNNGGHSWTRLSKTPEGDESKQRSMRVAPAYAKHNPALWFMDSENGLMARLDGEVYRTNDGGKTWKAVLRVDKSITDIFFHNKQVGVIVGDQGFMARTNDGGQTWFPASIPTKANLTGIFFANRQVGCAVGYSGTILHTKDGGVTWKQASISGLRARPPLASVSFADELRGWAVGGHHDAERPFSTSSSNVILKTEDGGQTWHAIRL